MPNTREKLIDLMAVTSLEFEDAVALADHLIANGVTVQEWISVKDRLPDMYQNVLAIRADGKMVVDAIGSLEIWYKQMDIVGRPVTHWMPLPQPPKGELNEEV